jgi:fatty acid desaturase
VDAAVEESHRNSESKEYLQLRRLVAEQGLLDRQYLYYAVKVLGSLAALFAGVAVIVVFDQFWVQMINAVFLAGVFAHFGFIGHDSGHRQIFHSPFRNDLVMLLAGLVTGMTPSWWQDKHNAHHRNPNQLSLDGDIEVVVFAFTEEQALESRGFLRFLVRYQAFLFYPTLLLTSLSLVGGGLAYLLRRERVRYPLAEITMVLAGIGLYAGILFVFLPAWQAVVFILVHRALAGLHMGSVFAPNHKGMPVLEPGTKLDFLRQQALTSRDVIPNPVIDFSYGGLNYQIEHHLFPNMPRNQLRNAREVVKSFCRERGIPYHETGFWRSHREILGYMHEVSAPLRRSRGEAGG